MEIDITEFVMNKDLCMRDFSASAAEFGDNAGEITWQAALEEAEMSILLRTEEEREAFRVYVKGFGAWPEFEIWEWDERQLNALFIQFVAGAVREVKMENASQEQWAQYFVELERQSKEYSGLQPTVEGDKVFFLLY